MSWTESIDVPERRTDRKPCAYCGSSAAGCRTHSWMTGFKCCPACFGNHDRDRTVAHASCTECQPPSEPGRRFLAACGAEAVSILGVGVHSTEDFPPDRYPCPDCLEQQGEPCRWCGAE